MSDLPDFDLDAASLRTDGGELSISIEVLASKLEQSLPGRTRVRREGGGLLRRGGKHVKELLIELGATSYKMEVEGQRLQGFRERTVGGVAIKHEPLDPGVWITELTAALRSEAQRSAEASKALAELLE